MFTGLVERLGRVSRVVEEPPGRRLAIEAADWKAETELGASIAVNGCCLTVVEIAGDELVFQAGPETLLRTNLGRLAVGHSVNLERALRVGDRLGGHYVTGHVDAVGVLDEIAPDADWATYWFRVPAGLTRQMASKGSIAVDGVSLTLVDVTADRFSVCLIPHTLSATTFGALQPGDPVNLETDLLAKYVEQQLAARSFA